MIANLRDHVRVTPTPANRHAREPSNARATNLNSRYAVIGVVLMIALLAFELFNFDTTQFALTDLLGDVRFGGLKWATILAIAFCGIDFAGLLRVFTPENDSDTPSEVWYLMAAWLLGATLNATMTWYAVSLTLVNNHVGNAVLSQEQLLMIVPIFVAFLVWLTRILFIGALSTAGGRLLDQALTTKTTDAPQRVSRPAPIRVPKREAVVRPAPAKHVPRRQRPLPLGTEDEAPTIFAPVPRSAAVEELVGID